MKKKPYREFSGDPLFYKVKEEDLSNFGPFIDWVTDIPCSQALHPININRVGITKQQIIVNIKDFINEGRVIPVLCSIDAYVNLDQQKRGIHMSRIVEAIMKTAKDGYETLDDFAAKLVEEIGTNQTSEKAYVELSGTAIVDRPTLKSGKLSSDRFRLINQSVWTRSSGIEQKTGLQAYTVAVCPCTRAFSKFSKAKELAKKFSLETVNEILDHVPTYSHSQRGLLTLIIDRNSTDVSIGELYSILNRSGHLVFDLLKRPDEHELTRLAYEKSQFTEDIVREVFVNLHENYWGLLSDDTYVFIESVLFESIHFHCVSAIIEGKFGVLAKQIKER